MMIFNGSRAPAIYGTALGADFPKALVDGLLAQYADQPPEALAQLRLVLNTSRMARRVEELFDKGGARLLPKISLIADPAALDWPGAIAPATSKLQRQLELAPLIRRLIESDPTVAPKTAVFDLAASLADLIGEMHEQGVTPESVTALDVSDQSGHWQRMKQFIEIAQIYFGEDSALDAAARQRKVIEALTARWGSTPPDAPILIAGSTGSRGPSAALLCAVARLPLGAVLLPGFDFAFAHDVMPDLPKHALGEDHPQYRFTALLDQLDATPSDVMQWPGGEAPNPQRTSLMSLALRPAPVTDQWLREAPNAALTLPKALDDVTLLEAPNARMEAGAIALRLRQAAEDGTRAAVITPDRTLARRIGAALDRWGITPDESTGEPLHLSPLGRLMRDALEALSPDPVSAERMIALLKHPLAGGDAVERGDHLRFTREFELYVRRKAIPYPNRKDLSDWADGEAATRWAAWAADTFEVDGFTDVADLDLLVAQHRAITEALTGAVDENGASIWLRPDGTEIEKILRELEEAVSSQMTLVEYGRLLQGLLQSSEMRRNTSLSHPDILIWGTLEARVQGVDLLILAGLNEGTWPEAPAPDPWLNRRMRAQLGMLSPERRIGLSAHDFQQATAAKTVWMTRSTRSDDAETVASRWVIRLTNLLEGLPAERGTKALKEMRARGAKWLSLAGRLDKPESNIAFAKRPAPCPPAAMRPKQLSITEIQRLIRDPYAIYARHVLRLRPLNPLQKIPDALMRGTVLHEVMERFVVKAQVDREQLNREALMAIADEVLAREVPFPAARLIWRARFARLVDDLIAAEEARLERCVKTHAEEKGALTLSDIGFTLVGKADRFDLRADGTLAIFDYKTGAISTKTVRQHFDKQLQLTAAMAEEAAFEALGSGEVRHVAFLGLGSKADEQILSAEEYETVATLTEFRQLILAFQSEEKGYPSRRAVQREAFEGDYDHLARYGEWSADEEPELQVLK